MNVHTKIYSINPKSFAGILLANQLENKLTTLHNNCILW